MRIKEIREKAIKLRTNLRNAAFAFDEMTTSVVAVITDVVRNGKPVTGYAFNSTGRYACGAQMRDRFIPRLMKANGEDVTLDPKAFDPDKILAAMMKAEKPGGDCERSVGIGTIEVAIWDAVAKIADVPAYKLIADKYRGGNFEKRMFCYVGGGWYAPGKGIPELLDEVRMYRDLGYTLIKIKVGGAPITEDVARLEAVIKLLGDSKNVAVDANCGIPPDKRKAYAQAIKPLNIRWFEEVAHPNDYAGNAEFIEWYGNPVATGENLFSLEDVRNLVRHGGMRPGIDVVQTDMPQTYGLGTAARIVKMLEQHGWRATSLLPHGGNQMSLNQAAGFGLGMCEAYLNVFGEFAGYCDDLKVEDGWMTLGDWTGMGFERQAKLIGLMRDVGP